jgi:hypothetical protein
MDNAVSQRVVTNSPHPPDDKSLPLMQQNKIWQETQLPKAKPRSQTQLKAHFGKNPFCKLPKARSQTERVEGVALTEFYNQGETVIPSDGKWKLMGLEWLKKLEKAKHGAELFSGVRDKGRKLKYEMHLAPTEGQTMWVLRHTKRGFDVLMRKRKS